MICKSILPNLNISRDYLYGKNNGLSYFLWLGITKYILTYLMHNAVMDHKILKFKTNPLSMNYMPERT